jgi:hypothetical protein
LSKVGDELLKSMAQALAYAQGKRVVGVRVHRIAVKPVDVRKARKAGSRPLNRVLRRVGLGARERELQVEGRSNVLF